MSTSIDVHANRWRSRYLGSVSFEADFKEPAIVRVRYRDGGPTIAGDHMTTIYIGGFGAERIRNMAISAQEMADRLFAKANELDEEKAT